MFREQQRGARFMGKHADVLTRKTHELETGIEVRDGTQGFLSALACRGGGVLPTARGALVSCWCGVGMGRAVLGFARVYLMSRDSNRGARQHGMVLGGEGRRR